MSLFECRSYGKWILAGEHAVLRGCPALVFPFKSHSMDLYYRKTSEDLSIQFLGDSGRDLNLLFWGLLQNVLDKVGRSRSDLKGEMKISSQIPLGAGLGASAALCVAIARWCEHLGWIEQSKTYEFARSLEDFFHGESSGVDIAVALSGAGLKFTRDGERSNLTSKWEPQFYLSYSGKRGVTSECVKKVQALIESDPGLGQSLDLQMKKAVELAEKALSSSEKEGLQDLIESMNLSRNCFESWGLTEGELDSHMAQMTEAGAIAVKPTGSGGGGYVLSLWSEPPKLPILFPANETL